MSLSFLTAYLLVSHGSRDPRPQAAMNRLAQLVRDRLQKVSPQTVFYESFCLSVETAPNWSLTPAPEGLSTASAQPYPTPSLRPPLIADEASMSDWEANQPYPIVGTACLELAALPLHEQIYEFCLRAKGAGVERVQIVPVFLLQGVHVLQDIPTEIALARQKLGSSLQVELCRHLGSHPGLSQLLKAKMADTASESWLILAHGSRRPEGNRPVEALAEALNAAVALWSIPGNLENQVVKLMQSGCQRLTILPYFLFTGDTTDAITRVTEELAERFPKMSFRLLPPLGATAEVAQLIAEIALNCCPQGAGSVVTPMKRVALRH